MKGKVRTDGTEQPKKDPFWSGKSEPERKPQEPEEPEVIELEEVLEGAQETPKEADKAARKAAQPRPKKPPKAPPPPKKKKGESDFKLGIIGGTSSGKTSYVYALGLLKTTLNEPMKGWEIGGFTPEYSSFFSQVDTEKYKKDWQLTRLFYLSIFEMFPIAKKELQVNVTAFDASGENFVAAVVPAEFEKIPKDSKQIPVINRLREEILSCDGFIFLIDSELRSQERVNELLEVNETALLPHQLLLHFTNFFRANMGIKTGKIQKPIAYALTKADCANDPDYPLTYFEGVREDPMRSVNPGADQAGAGSEGQAEAKRFIEFRFSLLYNVAKDWANKSFHAISCWGHEPIYYYNPDPQDSSRIVEIPRNMVSEYRRQEKGVKIWVKDIQPVCIQDPLIQILEEIEKRAFQDAAAKRRRGLVWLAAAACLALIYPFLAYTSGNLLEGRHYHHPAGIMYIAAGGHPFFKLNPLKSALAERHLEVADSALSNNRLDLAFDHLARGELLVRQLQGSAKDAGPVRETLVKTLYSMNAKLLDKGEYERAIGCLYKVKAVKPDDAGIESRLCLSVLALSQNCVKQGLIEKNAKLMVELFKEVGGSDSIDDNLRARVNKETGTAVSQYVDLLTREKKHKDAISLLLFAHVNQEQLGIKSQVLQKSLFANQMGYALECMAGKRIDEGVEALKAAGKSLPSDTPGSSKQYAVAVYDRRNDIGFERSVLLLREAMTASGANRASADALREAMVEMASAHLQRNEPEQALVKYKHLLTVGIGDKNMAAMVSERIARHASGLKPIDRLAFVDMANKTLDVKPGSLTFEAQTVTEIASDHLSSGRPEEAMNLLNSRPYLNNPEVQKLKSHASKASGMAFVPGGDGIKPFYMDRYEVSNREYEGVFKNNAELRPVNWDTSEYANRSQAPDCPVIYVTYDQAKAYARSIGKRLPSVREWEAAWGSGRYPWGSGFQASSANTLEQKRGQALGRADDLVLNDRSPHGVHGLAGNVSEFTADAMQDEKGQWRAVVKGGSYPFEGSGASRNENRKVLTHASLPEVGFRCAMNALP